LVRLLLLFFVVFSSFFAGAQRVTSDSTSGRNVLKLNLASLAFSTTNLQYERKLSEKQAAAIGLFYRIRGPVFNYIDRIDDSPIQNLELSTFAITPEIKFYLNQVFDGLYIGAYGRYRTNMVDFTYSDRINFSYEENVLHLGGIIGYQKKITKDIYVDFWLLGIGITQSVIEGSGTDPNSLYGPGYIVFNNLNGLYHRTFTYTRAQNFRFNGEAWRASFRGVGINIGIRF